MANKKDKVHNSMTSLKSIRTYCAQNITSADNGEATCVAVNNLHLHEIIF